jgi:hypothetical protein
MQRSALIDHHRGEMLVKDRAGLEATACACYVNDQQACADVLG